MRDFSLHLPINSVSFGQVSVALLREFHARGLQPSIFPISDQYDLAAQENITAVSYTHLTLPTKA